MQRGPKPFLFKVCPICGVNKPRSEYYKKGETVSHACKPCSLASSKQRAHKYRGKYSDTQNRWRRTKYATDPAYRERISENKKRGRLKRLDAINEERRNRYSSDPVYRAATLAHNKRLKACTPHWVDSRHLRAIYLMCPDGHEVDHIIPILGRIDGRRVSGLHVPWNLQYLPCAENRRKHCWITESLVPNS